MNRRDFIRNATSLSGVVLAPGMAAAAPAGGAAPQPRAMVDGRVALVRTMDRRRGTAQAIDLLQLPRLGGRDVFVKPNYNSADKAPGSTHEDTLTALLTGLRERGAGSLTIGDRSGMGNTREVMDKVGAFRIGREFGARVVVLDELGADDWELLKLPGSQWQQGFALPRLVRSAGAVVQACCLKTHRYGGHFTLSLKNSVGLAAKRIPGQTHDFMRELHNSPLQRQLIAEINAGYRPELVLLDGVQAFVDGGPDQGTRVDAGVVLAGTDRIAVDAVGIAVLRHLGTTPEVSRGTIFAQEQIARAVQLGLGVSGPDQIELVTGDRDSAQYAARIRPMLDAPGPG